MFGIARLTGPNDAFWEWIEEWSQFAPGFNWRTFHPIMVEMEDDRIMGGVEATVIVLGLGFRFRWNYAVTETRRKIEQRMEDVRSGRVKATPIPPLVESD